MVVVLVVVCVVDWDEDEKVMLIEINRQRTSNTHTHTLATNKAFFLMGGRGLCARTTLCVCVSSRMKMRRGKAHTGRQGIFVTHSRCRYALGWVREGGRERERGSEGDRKKIEERRGAHSHTLTLGGGKRERQR